MEKTRVVRDSPFVLQEWLKCRLRRKAAVFDLAITTPECPTSKEFFADLIAWANDLAAKEYRDCEIAEALLREADDSLKHLRASGFLIGPGDHESVLAYAPVTAGDLTLFLRGVSMASSQYDVEPDIRVWDCKKPCAERPELKRILEEALLGNVDAVIVPLFDFGLPLEQLSQAVELLASVQVPIWTAEVPANSAMTSTLTQVTMNNTRRAISSGPARERMPFLDQLVVP
jgi:hypothetical protein